MFKTLTDCSQDTRTMLDFKRPSLDGVRIKISAEKGVVEGFK